MMFLSVILLSISVCGNFAAILKCDFETACSDLTVDFNWGYTDGLHPHGINYDHTLNSSAGHYIFFTPQPPSHFNPFMSEIKTSDWLDLPDNESICFQMWYFTPRGDVTFTIQLIEGDDELMTRILKVVHGDDPFIRGWTLINLAIPAERMKLAIRLNMTGQPLVFDDISIDYCEGPIPTPQTTLFECDFESSCSDKFISLPYYSYNWLVMTAADASKTKVDAPSFDYTYRNSSGHYALALSSKMPMRGNVGYFLLEHEFNITANDSICLNFEYYSFGTGYYANLKVYTVLIDSPQAVQFVWPSFGSQYSYTKNKWVWVIKDLPIGYYKLLFQVDNQDSYVNYFAIDNISVKSCDYRSQEYPYPSSLLFLSCNFDDLTMCEMQSQNPYIETTYNFSVATAETIYNKDLGPNYDHTTNSSTGGFLYWDRQLPFRPTDSGLVQEIQSVESNSEMCIRFAYYVKATINGTNGTTLSLSESGCSASMFWYKSLDDSEGWQEVSVRVPNSACMENYIFSVSQRQLVRVSVAFDDIEIGQCSIISPTTTTTTTTTVTTSTSTTTVTTTVGPSKTTITEGTTSITTETTPTTSIYDSTTETTPHSNGQRTTLFIFYLGFSIYLLLNIFFN